MKSRVKPRTAIGLVVLSIVFACLILGRPVLLEKLDGESNFVLPIKHRQISDAVMQFHNSLFIADLHADSLLSYRDLLVQGSVGHADLPRLQQGNVGLQAFTIVTQVPWGLNIESNPADSDLIPVWAVLSMWPTRTWSSLYERTRFQIEKLEGFAAQSNGALRIITGRKQLSDFVSARELNPKLLGGVLGIEGAHALEGKLDNVDRFFSAGVRYMGLVHFFDNEIGGSAHGLEKGGLSRFGYQVIDRMEKLGMAVDLAHASAKVFREVIALAQKPVIVSHTGVRGTCDNQRNLSDEQIQSVAATGGVVGIGFWKEALCEANAESIALAIRYVTNLVGIEHVAFGSDFDGGTTVPFDATGMIDLTEALLNQGFTKSEIRKISGENTLRVLLETLPE
jgi:membrane dipeptidase